MNQSSLLLLNFRRTVYPSEANGRFVHRLVILIIKITKRITRFKNFSQTKAQIPPHVGMTGKRRYCFATYNYSRFTTSK